MQKFFDKFITSPESGAIMLTLSQTIHDEEQIKEFLKSKGFLCAVTEIGGNSSYPEFQEKITYSVISASIKCGVIKRIDKEVHACSSSCCRRGQKRISGSLFQYQRFAEGRYSKKRSLGNSCYLWTDSRTFADEPLPYRARSYAYLKS